jgi:aminoglycoside phosphotransferase (APT) family kinase protein
MGEPAGEAAKISHALARYLTETKGESAVVSATARLTGGASHETWAFEMERQGASAQRYVVRRAGAEGLLDTDLAREFALLKVLHARGAPVPAPQWCALPPNPLDSPFMITEHIEGLDIRKVLATTAVADRAALGRALVKVQAQLHRTPLNHELNTLFPARAWGAPAEVEQWAGVIERDRQGPQPILHAALQWLRAHPPECRARVLVHGDFKTNNLLFRADGTAVVIDWEMAHVGDPVEDLAWTLLWTTEFDLVGGLLSEAEYLQTYTAATSTEITPERLFFWKMFSLVKLAAIFVTGARQGANPKTPRPQLAMLGRAVPWLERKLAQRLAVSR